MSSAFSHLLFNASPKICIGLIIVFKVFTYVRQVHRHKLNFVYLHKVCSPHVVDTEQETSDVIMKKNRTFRAFRLYITKSLSQ